MLLKEIVCESLLYLYACRLRNKHNAVVGICNGTYTYIVCLW